ncbi:MAG TPA: exonuclease [Deltaproteobacteria bacterium]|nr:MAG: exonuclease [Deltaproteobacteria bacterium GWA2_55_82]OGQ62108.1 MAG: exonuclease [Deltaproteobacteria bacterium RIFCSPLOWO2_02_FULL_55_12]OIJ74033.1 MAG: exonuclease [Deltaproteobacteria bacterium GWC2_55_46]HBG46641.1 exonuclease [Deltaproteobacteria bacterium]HCY11351.1 exonuclease [Deltaproteobacteria bacterium]
MLKHTFCHIPGVGLKTERKLWDKGVITWDCPLGSFKFKRTAEGVFKAIVDESRQRLSDGDTAYFGRLLPAKESWRLFSEFRNEVAYIDIETNGYVGPYGYITAISLYDGKKVRYYIKGENLDDFKEDIFDYKVLVTYNGKCFDIPFIESHMGIRLPHAHIDLRYTLRDLGFKGGLKGCEKLIGIERGGLDGVDGYFAVLLWKDFRRNKNPRALETLMAYNIQDVVNLEPLMITAHNLKTSATPFEEAYRIELPSPPMDLPFKPDLDTIERIRTARAHIGA